MSSFFRIVFGEKRNRRPRGDSVDEPGIPHGERHRLSAGRRRAAPTRARLGCETLESRQLLSTIGIIGSDDRVLVTNTTTFPWSAVGRMVATFPDGTTAQCSGAMVGARDFLTAGHCMYDSSHGGSARSITVAPGQNGTSQPFGVAYSMFTRTPTGWTQNHDFNYDYSLVTLNQSIGRSTGTFGLSCNTSYVAPGVRLNSAGYPADRGGSQSMYFGSGTVGSATDTRVSYTIDMAHGQSGSPVWIYTSGQRYIVAVESTVGTSYNYGTRMNCTRVNQINGWISQDGGRMAATSSAVNQPLFVAASAQASTTFASAHAPESAGFVVLAAPGLVASQQTAARANVQDRNVIEKSVVQHTGRPLASDHVHSRRPIENTHMADTVDQLLESNALSSVSVLEL